MSDPTNRYLALELAVRASRGDVDGLVSGAQLFYDFLEGPQDPKAVEPPKETGIRKRRSAGAAETPAGSTQPKNSALADAQPESAGTTAKSDIDSLFGEDEPDATETPTKAKAPVLEDVRAAIVDAQTALGHKKYAKAILTKFTTNGEPLFDKLPEGKYADVIAICTSVVDDPKAAAKLKAAVDKADAKK